MIDEARDETQTRPQRVPKPTLATGFSLRHNALNFLRVFGALAVIVAHSPNITGVGHVPRVGAVELGIIPVSYFFVISGFLITSSRHKLDGPRFTARRLARIMPGYWLCLIVTGFALAWIAGRERGGWTVAGATEYVLRNLLFLPGQGPLGGTLDGAYDSSTWNGSVWTIPMELFCYTVIGLAITVPLLRRHLRLLSSVTVVALIGLGTFVAQTNPEPGALYLITFFAGGVWLFAWQERIQFTDTWGLVSLAITAVCFCYAETVFLATLPFAYVVFWFSARAPEIIKRIGSRNDISYGVYVYAWPVQQVLAAYGVHEHGLVLYNVLAMAGATALGWISWLGVERGANEWTRRKTSSSAATRRVAGA